MQQNANRSSDSQIKMPAAEPGCHLPAAVAMKIGNMFNAWDCDDSHHLKLMLQSLLDLVGGGFAVYYRFCEQTQQVYVRQAVDNPEKFRQIGCRIGRVCCDAFGAHRHKAICFDDLRATSFWQSDPDVRGYGLKAFLGCTVCLDQEVIGSLAVYNNQPRKFSADDLAAIEMIAKIVAYQEKHHRAERRLITQLKQERQNNCSIIHRLDESEALTFQMFQLSPVAIYRIDLSRQRFLAVNDHMCKVTGYSKEEFLSLKPMRLLTCESLKLYRKRLKDMVEGRPISNNVDYEVITKSGAIEWARLDIRHLFEHGRIVGAMVVAHFITGQKKTREELALYRRELESLVQARTGELAEMNRQLREEIEQRKQTAMELQASSDRLHEMNTAMSVLLDKRSEDHQRAEELIRLNLKELIDPFLNRLESSGLRRTQKQLLEIIRMNLEEMVGVPTPDFSSKYFMFSPNEFQVANLIRQGRTSKEIARLINLSARTVDSYRDSIRKKLGLKNKKVNLRTYLASL